MDIALDTFPYNGTTTTCEALWMGVPVLTLSGKTHRSRVGLALLGGLGLEGLAASDPRGLALAAAGLARDPERLSELRRTLRSTMASSPLTDGAGFTRGLERALREAWQGWCRKRSPLPAPEAGGADPDGEFDALLDRLAAGDGGVLGGIQNILDRELALDRARALEREEGVVPAAEGIRSESLERCAALLFAAELLTPAELVCRYLEDRGYRSAKVSLMLGEAALALGQPGVAARELLRAVEAGDDSRGTRIRLVKAQEQARLESPPKAKERYLLVKAWGYGFWSDVSHLIGQFLLAELTGRVPVVHWGGNSLFGDDPKQNAFLNFFLPVNDLTVWDLVTRAKSFYPPKWNRANLALDELQKFEGAWSRTSSLHALERSEDVVVSDFYYGVNDLKHWIPPGHPLYGFSADELSLVLFQRYLKVRPELALRARTFHAAHLSGRPVLALHVRGGDKVGEDPGLARLNALYHPVVERFLSCEPEGKLFLLTDDRRILAEYLKRYPGRVSHTISTRTGSEQGVHYAKHKGGRRALGEEVLVDALIATLCDRFVGNGLSNVSTAVAQLKRWPHGSCHLFGARLDRLRQVTLYRS